MIFKKALFLFLFSTNSFFLFGFPERAGAVVGDSCNYTDTAMGEACPDGGFCYENICKEACPSVASYGSECSGGGRCYPRLNGDGVKVMICEKGRISEADLPCGSNEKSLCREKEYNNGVVSCGAFMTFDTAESRCEDIEKNLICCQPKDSFTCPSLKYGEKCPGTEGFCYGGICKSGQGGESESCGTLGGICDSGTMTDCPLGTTEDNLSEGGRGCLESYSCCVDDDNLPADVCKNKKDGDKCGEWSATSESYCYDEKCDFGGGMNAGDRCGVRENSKCASIIVDDITGIVSCPKGSSLDKEGRQCASSEALLCCNSNSDDDDDNDDNNNSSDPLNLSALYPKHVFCKDTDPQLEEGTSAGFQLFRGSIVPCGRSCDDPKTEDDEMAECTLCHFILMGKRIYDFVFSLLIIVSLFTITIGGILYMISGANPSLNTTAKEIIKKTLIGFALFLGSWVIVFTVLNLLSANTSLIGKGGDKWFEFSCDTKSVFTPGDKDGEEDDGDDGDDDDGGDGEEPGGGSLPTACEEFNSFFDEVAGGDKNLKCLLVGIAMGESSCNASADNGEGDCGLMQVSGGNCQHWKDYPKESIEYAKNMLSSNKRIIDSYESKYGYNIGSSYSPGATATSKYGKTYYTGNDDLIASYNGGVGDGVNDGKKEPFHISLDCKAPDYPATPAWQCPINPGEFGTATQPYVVNVQKYQRQCLGK